MIREVLGAQHVILNDSHYISTFVNYSVLSQALLGGFTVSEGLEFVLFSVLRSQFSLQILYELTLIKNLFLF